MWSNYFSIVKELCLFNHRGREVKSLSRVRLFVTPWTVDYQASLSMEFSRQEYWNGLPFPPPGVLPDQGIELSPPTLHGRKGLDKDSE